LFLSVYYRNLLMWSIHLLNDSGVKSINGLGHSSIVEVGSEFFAVFLSLSFLALVDLISPKLIAV